MTLKTLNEVTFKQHDKRKVIGKKVNGFRLTTARLGPGAQAQPARLLRHRYCAFASSCYLWLFAPAIRITFNYEKV